MIRNSAGRFDGLNKTGYSPGALKSMTPTWAVSDQASAGADRQTRCLVAAVQTSPEGHSLYLQLRRVQGFTLKAIARYAQHSVAPASKVYSDGLACFKAFEGHGCTHQPIVTGGGRASAQNPNFKWVNTLLGNVKNALRGTFHAFDLKHSARYLAEFEYRFNRRFDLGSMIERFSHAALRTPPMPYRLLKMAEVYT